MYIKRVPENEITPEDQLSAWMIVTVDGKEKTRVCLAVNLHEQYAIFLKLGPLGSPMREEDGDFIETMTREFSAELEPGTPEDIQEEFKAYLDNRYIEPLFQQRMRKWEADV